MKKRIWVAMGLLLFLCVACEPQTAPEGAPISSASQKEGMLRESYAFLVLLPDESVQVWFDMVSDQEVEEAISCITIHSDDTAISIDAHNIHFQERYEKESEVVRRYSLALRSDQMSEGTHLFHTADIEFLSGKREECTLGTWIIEKEESQKIDAHYSVKTQSAIAQYAFAFTAFTVELSAKSDRSGVALPDFEFRLPNQSLFSYDTEFKKGNRNFIAVTMAINDNKIPGDALVTIRPLLAYNENDAVEKIVVPSSCVYLGSSAH